jgi:hypothetical protein
VADQAHMTVAHKAPLSLYSLRVKQLMMPCTPHTGSCWTSASRSAGPREHDEAAA